MSAIAISKFASPEILAQIREVTGGANKHQGGQVATNESGQSFTDLLKDGIKEVNTMQKVSDKKSMEIASGKSGELHEAMLAATQAELTFNLMVQVRNKALEAYQDIMRMQV